MEHYDEYAACPKCGGASIGTRWVVTDVIKRLCDTCGYEWRQRPLDAPRDPIGTDGGGPDCGT